MIDLKELKEYLQKPYESADSFLENVIFKVFGEEFYEDTGNLNVFRVHPELKDKAEALGIVSARMVGQILVEGSELGIFDITVTSKRQLDRSRVDLQEIVRRIISTESGAFMIFHYKTMEGKWDWRFTFCRKGASKDDSTDAKRYTFLLGPGQSCRTAAENFKKLAEEIEQTGEIELEDIETAFDVEALSKEFFKKYKEHYERFCQFAYDNRNNREYFGEEFGKWDDKIIRDYVKKLLGRIVFLHFLQKKGWMGVPADKEWGDGDVDFMRNLWINATEEQKKNYLDKVLEPLFSDALDTDRKANNDLFDTGVEHFREVKIPYLNGGLFERDKLDEPDSRFPMTLFNDLFEFFYEYNFTIDENDPNDAQVGVDPEMLGMIFENLLEDNKDKGAFYTPKEIVQYMCKESLIAYLQTNAENDETKEAIRQFVTTYDVNALGGKESELAQDIDDLLLDVKICDPAIGSGAFPMGLLKELFYCRGAIEDFCNASGIKKHIIQHNIYGVDIEKGAVDIARLRFWLSLIVDEETPHALPNMDFKIMQGNSLVESYNNVPLCNLTSKKQDEQLYLFDDMVDVYRRELRKKITEFYDCKNHNKRNELKREIVKTAILQLKEDSINIDFTGIDVLENNQFFLWHTWFAEVFDKGGFDIVIGNPPYIDAKKLKSQSKILKTFKIYDGTADIFTYFYEQGFNLLANNGVLTLITSNKWMRSGYGRNLRHLLLSNQLLYLLDFGRNRLFNATVDTDITISRKSPNNSKNIVCSLNDVDLNIGIYKAVMENCLFNFELTDESWLITKGDKDFIKAKLDLHQNSINKLGVKVYRGILTGCNSAYHIDESTKNNILCNDPQCSDIVKPLIRGIETDRYLPKRNTLWLINVHNGLKNNLPPIDVNNYPSIKAHLNCYIDDVFKRGDQGLTPYNLRNCAYLNEFDKPKIIWQGVSKRVAYCYDEEGEYYCDVTAFFMTGSHLKFVLALLNSKLFGYSLVNIYLEGDTFKSKNKIIQDFPVPDFTPKEEQLIETLVNKILSAKKENPHSDTSSLEAEIDQLVYKLYDLTPEEISIVEGKPINNIKLESEMEQINPRRRHRRIDTLDKYGYTLGVIKEGVEPVDKIIVDYGRRLKNGLFSSIVYIEYDPATDTMTSNNNRMSAKSKSDCLDFLRDPNNIREFYFFDSSGVKTNPNIIDGDTRYLTIEHGYWKKTIYQHTGDLTGFNHPFGHIKNRRLTWDEMDDYEKHSTLMAVNGNKHTNFTMETGVPQEYIDAIPRGN